MRCSPFRVLVKLSGVTLRRRVCDPFFVLYWQCDAQSVKGRLKNNFPILAADNGSVGKPIENEARD